MKKILIILLFLIISLTNIFAQSNNIGSKYIYEFRDGTTIIGTLLKEDAGNIYIRTEEGKETYIPEIMVAEIIEVNKDNLVNGEYWFPNLHDTRYFFSPSAFGLEKGEGYYSHSYWLLWQAQYGFSDNFSLGAGTTPLGTPYMLNAKFAFNLLPKSNMAFGWLYIGARNSDLKVNMPYAVYTYGSKESNITIGAGLGMTDFFGEEKRALGKEDIVLNMGAVHRISRRFSLAFEAWVFNSISPLDITILGGPGIRYFRKVNRVTAKNGSGASTWDFQFFMSPEMAEEGVGFMPMFGASRKF